ncbi:MAG: Ig-like domain-containing protein [bacterium]
MHKFSRTLLLAGVLAFGTLSAACGDKVTVAGPGGAAGVQLVTVTPPSATISVGQSIILSGQVTADAASAKTVTWTTSSAAVASVDQTGKVTGVTAGVVTITATSTADASKAASSVITVGAGTNTAPQISISTINKGGVPAILTGTGGQLDVTLLATGGAGKVDLFLAKGASCGTTTIAADDSLVATQNTPATQTGPITLSFNTAGLNTNNTPKFLNGNYCIKSRITTATGTAVAANTVPLTIINASFYTGTITFTKTTTLGAQNAISPTNGLRFDQGDLTVAITPVNYVGGSPVAQLSVTLDGTGKTLVLTPATGTQTFTGTFSSAACTTCASSSIYQYQTTATGGDNLFITSATDAAGQPVSFATTVTIVGPTGNAAALVRIDNASPVTVALANAGNGLPTTNFVNASYSFASSIVAASNLDANSNFPVSTVFGYALNDASFTAIAGTSTSPATCSQTGWTIVADPSSIPNSPGASQPIQYRLREFSYDALGNIRCMDIPNPFGVDKENPTLSVTGPADKTVIVTNTLMSSAFADSISGFVLGAQVSYTDMRNFSTANCVYGTTANGCTIVQGPTINIDNGSGTQAYYVLTAKSVDQAGNSSPAVTRIYLLDSTAPVVQGISIPQNLTGGVAQTFTSTATDNVDLQASSFDIAYSAASGLTLYYAGQSYGPNYDATLVTSTAVNATVPFFIKQIQATAAGAPVALAPADSGEAQSITVRAIDAANLISIASTAAIPNINISSSSGYSTVDFNTFSVTNAAQNINNGSGTTTTSTNLTAAVMLNSGSAQSAATPFAQVCYFYQQTAAGNVADPTIPTGDYVQIGCITAPSITDVAGVSRTWTYTLSGFNPPAALGTAGTINVVAIGVNAGGVGIATAPNANITLVP